MLTPPPRLRRSLKLSILLAVCAATAAALGAPASTPDPRDDSSPWGIAPGAEGNKEFSQFDPVLKNAGVRWLRLFAPWNQLEPENGQWTWGHNDEMLAASRANGIKTLGFLGYLAKWAGTDNNPRKFPLRDPRFWSDYVQEIVTRYHDRVKYWEVWNEFNGGFSVSDNKPRDYAQITMLAYDATKKVDPTAQVGISCANFDLNFFDKAIKAGAGGHFDFVCVHPYENLGNMQSGGEVSFLAMADNLRRLLADDKQRADMPLWITEFGALTDNSPEKDATQAEMLIKAYVLSLAQGFERVFWFEAMGPAIYGKTKNEGHGIVRADMSPRPAYASLKTMIDLLGPEPRYTGWLDIARGAYGFTFAGAHGPVMAAWAPPQGVFKLKFDAAVDIVDMAGKQTPLGAGQDFTLSKLPVFITNLPAPVVQLAAEDKAKPFPWGGDYAKADTISCKLGANDLDDGIEDIRPDHSEVVIIDQTNESVRSTVAGKPNLLFRVHPSFAATQPRDVEITLSAREAPGSPPVDLSLMCETEAGYKPQGDWKVPSDNQWHENTWTVHNVNFVGQWGYNFAFNVIGPGKCLFREVQLKRLPGTK